MNARQPVRAAGIDTAAWPPVIKEENMNTTTLQSPSPPAYTPRDDARPLGEPAAASKLSHCLALTLDEFDSGVLLVENHDEVLYSNHTARRELCDDHPLWLDGGRLRARNADAARTLDASLRGAARQGLRRMITFEQGERSFSVAVTPMQWTGQAAVTLVRLGRRSVCPTLSARAFASCYGLTCAEGAVLAALAAGCSPDGIARSQGVKLSTVRTHISNIRTKTGSASIRHLVERLAQLPPMVSALRH